MHLETYQNNLKWIVFFLDKGLKVLPTFQIIIFEKDHSKKYFIIF